MIRIFSYLLGGRIVGFGCCCLVVLGLLGCGGDEAQVKKYQETVLATLQGNGETMPHFTRSVGVTLKTVYCAQYNCVIAGEMEQLRLFSERETEYLGIYRNRACLELEAPQPMSEDAAILCDGLEKISQQIQLLMRNAELARDFLAQESVIQQWTNMRNAVTQINELEDALRNANQEQTLKQLEAIQESMLLVQNLDEAIESLNTEVRSVVEGLDDAESLIDNLDFIQATLEGDKSIQGPMSNLYQRILETHDRILDFYDDLRTIAWLDPVFENAEEELPTRIITETES